MNGLRYGKISKMPNKNYFGRTVAFYVLGVHNRVFPKKIYFAIHLETT